MYYDSTMFSFICSLARPTAVILINYCMFTGYIMLHTITRICVLWLVVSECEPFQDNKQCFQYRAYPVF